MSLGAQFLSQRLSHRVGSMLSRARLIPASQILITLIGWFGFFGGIVLIVFFNLVLVFEESLVVLVASSQEPSTQNSLESKESEGLVFLEVLKCSLDLFDLSLLHFVHPGVNRVFC